MQPVVKAVTAPVASATRPVSSSVRSTAASARAPPAPARRARPGAVPGRRRRRPRGRSGPAPRRRVPPRHGGPRTPPPRPGSPRAAPRPRRPASSAPRGPAPRSDTRAGRSAPSRAGQELRSLAGTLVGAAAQAVPAGTPLGDDLQLPTGCLTASLDLDVLRQCALAEQLGGTGGFLVGLLPTGMALVAFGVAVVTWNRRRRLPGSPVPA